MSNKHDYSAKDIEVLEGLEPVRKRPGMYIGGTDQNAIHQLFKEVLDNAMDEAVAGFATKIEVIIGEDGSITIGDNGRGIPVDPHPKFPKLSALEVIMTTLHSGGKFSGKAYTTAGGLHGVGVSVVNALSERLEIQVFKGGMRYWQHYSRGKPTTKLLQEPGNKNVQGTRVTFYPDPQIFGDEFYDANALYKIAKAKAYLFKGVSISWKCLHPDSLSAGAKPEATICYPGGLKDYVESITEKQARLLEEVFDFDVEVPDMRSRLQLAFTFVVESEGMQSYYCNTIPNALGGTHEQAFRSIMAKAFKDYAALVNYKNFSKVIVEDIMQSVVGVLSIFIPEPSFFGQTKDKLLSKEALKVTEVALKDRLDHALVNNPSQSMKILELIENNANLRISRKNLREVERKNPLKSIRLPGKLTDCHYKDIAKTEIFLVEGESAGGTAKQARNRDTQAILPLRGKILNVASATQDKMESNQEISDLIVALGAGVGSSFNISKLRYGRVIIMTDADVDGAHICSLLLTFFYLKMRRLIQDGHLYLAKPPLYRLTCRGEQYYVNSDAEKDQLVKQFTGKGAVEISRFKGLGEMNPKQLKETAMDPKFRTLFKVSLIEGEEATQELVNSLMGKKPELRLKFIQESLLTV